MMHRNIELFEIHFGIIINCRSQQINKFRRKQFTLKVEKNYRRESDEINVVLSTSYSHKNAKIK